MRRPIPLILAGVLMAGCTEFPTEPAEQVLAFGHKSSHAQPFRGRHVSQTADASGVACDAGQLAGRSIIVRGNATHLGRYSGDASACIVPTGPLSLVSATARMTLIAANGDEVWLQMDPADPQMWEVTFPEPGVVAVTSEGGFDVVGGTGRFDDATGHVRVTSSRVGSEDTEARLEGTISKGK
ncbi:MAG: hypothetical protein RH859_10725 [Longimicrobiales bacterium]